MELLQKKYRRGFTLIEVIVVIATLAFVLPIITIVLFMILRQQLVVARMTETKRQGDQVVTTIQNILTREVVSAHEANSDPLCEGVTNPAVEVHHFEDEQGSAIAFIVIDGALNIQRTDAVSGAVTTEPITNAQKATVEDDPNPPDPHPFVIECARNEVFTRPLVGINFSMIPAGGITAQELATSRLFFSTKVIIRNR